MTGVITLALMLVAYPTVQLLLFATSNSARTVIRQHSPESEASLLFPPNEFVLYPYPSSMLGGFRVAALFGDLPFPLHTDGRLHALRRRARVLLCVKAVCLLLVPVVFLVWVTAGK